MLPPGRARLATWPLPMGSACWANTIGPGLFLQSDYCIGAAEGAYPEYRAQWQGMSLCVTLQHPPTPWLASTFMPTMPGRMFFTRPLAGPLLPE